MEMKQEKTIDEMATHYFEKGMSFRKIREILNGKFPGTKPSEMNQVIRNLRKVQMELRFKGS